MIPGFTNELIARLIAIGRRETFGEFHQLLGEFPQVSTGQIMRHPFQEWYEVARQYSRDDVTSLIKALTVAERDLPNFCCGSVSPVIPLYRYLLDTIREDFTELRDWVVGHTRNPYLPFGSSRYRPASLSEYHHQTAVHETHRRQREQAEERAVTARRAARQKLRDEKQQARIRQRQNRIALYRIPPTSFTSRASRSYRRRLDAPCILLSWSLGDA